MNLKQMHYSYIGEYHTQNTLVQFASNSWRTEFATCAIYKYCKTTNMTRYLTVNLITLAVISGVIISISKTMGYLRSISKL